MTHIHLRMFLMRLEFYHVNVHNWPHWCWTLADHRTMTSSIFITHHLLGHWRQQASIWGVYDAPNLKITSNIIQPHQCESSPPSKAMPSAAATKLLVIPLTLDLCPCPLSSLAHLTLYTGYPSAFHEPKGPSPQTKDKNQQQLQETIRVNQSTKRSTYTDESHRSNLGRGTSFRQTSDHGRPVWWLQVLQQTLRKIVAHLKVHPWEPAAVARPKFGLKC